MTTSDFSDATAADQARTRLSTAGAADLPPRPWQHRGQPLADLEFVRFAAWAARKPDVQPDVVTAGMRLLDSARAELDQIEAGLLFAARAAGATWPELSQALGLRSAQAAQQRTNRIAARITGGAET